jgi:DNA-directed RNA polymerase subunit L
MSSKKQTSKNDSDVKVAVLDKGAQEKNLSRNFLKFKITGNDIDYVVVNTIRRIILSLVPSYAFYDKDILIDKNTSIFNNDEMRLRLANTPIVHNFDIPLGNILELEKEAITADNEKKMDLLQLELDNEKHRLELSENIQMYINAVNTTDDILNVTTDNSFVEFKLGDKKIDNIYPRPLLLIKLKPKEEFKALCVASLNIPQKNIIFQACSLAAYEQVDDHEFEFYLESKRQMSEKQILVKACEIFLIKLDNIKSKLMKALKSVNDSEAKIIIENENHTMGNILSHVCRKHQNVLFCGYIIDHLAINEVTFKFKVEGKMLDTVIKESCDKLKTLFESLISQFQKI